MPSVGGALSGASVGSLFGPVGTAVGGGLGFLFGGGGDDKKNNPLGIDVNQIVGGLSDASKRAADLAAAYNLQGQQGLNDALTYFQDILSGNPNAVLAATRADRGRVIDQYDTARKSIVNFGPRAGGTTSALADLAQQKATTLADITSTARREAAPAAADIGGRLAALGLSAEQLASSDLDTLINAALGQQGLDLQRRGQNLQTAAGVGETLGTLLGLFLTREQNGGGNGPTYLTDQSGMF